MEQLAIMLKKTVRDWPVDRVSRQWILVGTCLHCAHPGKSVTSQLPTNPFPLLPVHIRVNSAVVR